MAAKKPTVGALIKEARTNAGLTQEKLARLVDGLSASDLGKAERDEKALTKDQLKVIAKVTGVTQKSLLEAAESSTSSPKSTAKAGDFPLTAAEKKLITLYRSADSATKKKVVNLLSGESDLGSELLGELLNGALNTFLKGK